MFFFLIILSLHKLLELVIAKAGSVLKSFDSFVSKEMVIKLPQKMYHISPLTIEGHNMGAKGNPQ